MNLDIRSDSFCEGLNDVVNGAVNIENILGIKFFINPNVYTLKQFNRI